MHCVVQKKTQLWFMIFVVGSDGQSAYDVAQDAERVLIRSIGLDRLLNKRHGDPGRPHLTNLFVVFSSLF